ncbi:dTDP-4-dehydrorhamnose reductase [Yersinia enterocolitica]|uniref:dTDP-4-dehydrorhamnose reductase n=1 Tax=Yersinia mollaretii TaxID=33060 RepID=UPI0005E023D5|nr:dTDP-4-dehydrorhamnose reductase [Yersinia mollaretii]CNK75752.1 dTDP-4-dehydrorhamnose reductase [Yersinia enterocolitica]
MKILLTGANGQLGRCIKDRIPREWHLDAMGSEQLDITDKQQVIQVITSLSPDIIINAAAYTAVDKAESEPLLADNVNSQGVGFLASVAKKQGARLIHISTDYVFDGVKATPYNELDTSAPINVYGRTKLAGEQVIVTTLPNAVIIRTSWVFSEYGNNFVKTMLKLGKERKQLNIINDQRGCPTYAGDLAQAIIELIKNHQQAHGVYHYCGSNDVSWYDFAELIFEIAVNEHVLPAKPSITKIATSEYPTPAKRPQHSLLDCSKLFELGIRKSDWEKSLRAVIKKLNADAI